MTERRYPLQPLIDACGLSEAEMSRKTGLRGTPLIRARERGFVESAADHWACQAGFVPWHIWPEWLDDIIADCSRACEECETPFIPSVTNPGQRFCSRRCSARRWKRDRYQADPEFAELMKERARVRYEECTDYEKSRMQRWRAANPERVKATSAAWYEANREEAKAKMRAYYRKNADQIRAKQRARDRAKAAA